MACTECDTRRALDGAALVMRLTIVRTTHHDHNLIIIRHEVVRVYLQVCGHIEAMGSESQVCVLLDFLLQSFKFCLHSQNMINAPQEHPFPVGLLPQKDFLKQLCWSGHPGLGQHQIWYLKVPKVSKVTKM